MNALSGIYGRVARARRAWYQPHRQHRLTRPVISVGNLAAGGSGKTPVVAAIARLLLSMGEKPAILTRGYGRRSDEAMVVVSSGEGPAVGVDDSGDEPQMLARALPEVPIVVGSDRYRSGCWVESNLPSTVHILDDGFQHVRLARDVDIVLVSPADLEEAILPIGRLREPVESAAAADVVLVPGGEAERLRVEETLNLASAFSVTDIGGALRMVHPFRHAATVASQRVLAVAGIARPERFLASLSSAGFDVADSATFRDHHWYDGDDVRRIEARAAAAGVATIVTTEKDAVRLERLVAAQATKPNTPQWTYQPHEVRIEPEDVFRVWLSGRLSSARQSGANRFA